MQQLQFMHISPQMVIIMLGIENLVVYSLGTIQSWWGFVGDCHVGTAGSVQKELGMKLALLWR